MATTFSFIPLVGLNQIVALRNLANDNVLLQRSVPVYPDLPVDAPGRKGKMRIAFRLFQSDGTTADDLNLLLIVRCPIAFTLPEDAQNFPKWSPVCQISGLYVLGAADANPQIGQPIPAGTPFAGTPADPLVDIGIPMQFDSVAGEKQYDISIDWCHSIAS